MSMKDSFKVKLNRCRYFERDWISISTKKEVAAKTNNKCAICGKKIIPGTKDFTVDHFIPLNKGGRNDVINLIPLCGKCNKAKGDDVTTICRTYPFLKNKYKQEIKNLTERYLKEYNWIESTNFLTYDDQVVEIPIHRHTNKINGKIKSITLKSAVRIKKVKELTDDIISFVVNYNDYLGYETYYIDDMLQQLVNLGRLYTVTKEKDDDIKYLIHFKTARRAYIIDNKEHEFDSIVIGNIIGKPNQDSNTNWAKVAIISMLIDDLENSADALGMKTLSIGVETDIPTMGLYNDFRRQIRECIGVDPQIIMGEEEEGKFVVLYYDFGITKDIDTIYSISEEEFKATVISDIETWNKQLNIGRKKHYEN